MRRPPLPSPEPPFPAPFRALLPSLLATRGRIDAGRVERLRARRSALSHSGTFVGHRRYAHGDDLRRLDWAAYARTGELFTKQLEEEDRRAVTVVVDLSPSMLAGTPPRRTAALQLAAVLAGLALVRVDGVGIVAPGAPQPNARFAGTAQLPALLQHLESLPIVDSPPTDAAARALAGDAVGRVHWVSDFAAPPEFRLPLLALRRRGVRVSGFLPTIPDDEAPPAKGYVRVVDPETFAELAVPIDAALAAALREQLQRLAREQVSLFAEVGSPLWRWAVPKAGAVPTLADYLPIVAACAR